MSTSSVPASKASPKSKATPKPKAAKAPAAPSAAVMPTYARQNLVFESGAGSWLLLGATPGAGGTLTMPARVALAALGTSLLLAAVLRGFRLRTLLKH